MNKIIWFTGAIGSGKTTLASGLACSYPNTFFVDGDNISPELDGLTFDEMIPQRKKALFEKVQNISQSSTCVVAYPLSELDYNHLKSSGMNIVLIGLSSVKEGGCMTRDFSCWEKGRISKMLEKGLDGKGYADYYLEGTNSPYEALNKIKEFLENR